MVAVQGAVTRAFPDVTAQLAEAVRAGMPNAILDGEIVVMTADEVRTFFTRFEVMIGHMCRDLPRFTRAVSQIDWIPFNPFRDHYRLHP